MRIILAIKFSSIFIFIAPFSILDVIFDFLLGESWISNCLFSTKGSSTDIIQVSIEFVIREWQIDSQTVNSPIYLSPEKIARPRFSVPLPPTIELFPATKLFWVVSISCFSWSSISCDDELEFEVSPFILSELPLFEDEELSSE